MAIALNDNIKVNAPKPSEERYLNNILAYTSTTQVDTATVGRRYLGLTVFINGEEWWYKTTIADGGLILKTLGTANGVTGSGTTNNLTKWNSSTGLTDSNITDNGSLITLLSPTIISGNTNIIGTTSLNGNTSITGNTNIIGITSLSGNTSITGNTSVIGSLTANSFVKSGGTSAQFLMADGSVTSGSINGSGTTNTLPKFNSSTGLSNSNFTDNGSTGQYQSGSFIVQFNPGGNSILRMSRNQAFILFDNGNPDISQPFELTSSNYYGANIRSGGFMSLRVGSTYLESIFLSGNGQVKLSQTPSAGTNTDMVLTRDISSGFIRQIPQSGLSSSLWSGTTNYLPKFSGTTLVNSILLDTGNTVVLQSNLSFTSTTNVFDAYSNNILRTSLRPTGIQLWFLNNGVTEVGSISYSTPNGNPGLVFFNPTVTSRTDIRLNSQTGGLAFGTNSTGAVPSTQLLLNTNGDFLINTTIDNGVDKLQVQGSIISTAFKKSGGTSTQFLMADGSVTTGTSATTSISYWTAGTGINAIAVSGNNNIASGNYSLAEGLQTQAVGVGSHSEGGSTTAFGDYSHAEGGVTYAGGGYSHSEGVNTQANGFTSHAEGQNTVANGVASHSEGNVTTATGDYSHAEGQNTQAISTSSHAEGQGTIANNAYAHAEGIITQANGLASHSEGNNTRANGLTSHAEGTNSIAQGDYSHAGGVDSQALGTTSFVHGNNSIANNTNVNVFGASITGNTANTTYVDRFNIKTIPTGTSNNILGIDANGNVVIGLTISGNGTTNVIPKWSNSSGLTNSNLSDNGTVISASTGMIINDTISAGSSPLSGSVLNILQTWNTSGSPTAIKVNITNITAGTNANVFDFQISGSSQVQLNKFGTLSIGLGTGATPISNAKLDVYSTISGSTPFNVEGTQGQLFSVTDTMTGWIHGVNDISGVPLFRVNSNEYSEIKGELYFQDSNVTGGYLSGVTANTVVKTILLSENGGNMFFYDYYARNILTNAMRGGTVMALTDNTGITSTDSYVGDLNASTSGLTLNTIISGTNIVLSATITTGSWIIKANTRII